MFMSEDEALERLNSARNLFSDRISSSPPISSSETAAIVPELVEDDEEFELPCLTDLDNLDDLINEGHKASHVSPDGRQRAHYKGCRESQKAIGEVSALLGPTQASSLFGASIPQTFAYGEGQRSSNEAMGEIPELKVHLGQVKMQIAMTASRRLRRIVKAITPKKIDAITSPIELTRMGKDMATIVDKMSPRDLSDLGATLHIYRPETQNVNQYNIVNVRSGDKE